MLGILESTASPNFLCPIQDQVKIPFQKAGSSKLNVSSILDSTAQFVVGKDHAVSPYVLVLSPKNITAFEIAYPLTGDVPSDETSVELLASFRKRRSSALE